MIQQYLYKKQMDSVGVGAWVFSGPLKEAYYVSEADHLAELAKVQAILKKLNDLLDFGIPIEAMEGLTYPSTSSITEAFAEAREYPEGK